MHDKVKCYCVLSGGWVRKKRALVPEMGTLESGNSIKTSGATIKQVVGADFVEGNGTITKVLSQVIAEAVEPVASVPGERRRFRRKESQLLEEYDTEQHFGERYGFKLCYSNGR